jgi:hypothetical protein
MGTVKVPLTLLDIQRFRLTTIVLFDKNATSRLREVE